MKKRFLLSLMLGAFALSGVAQDDMYFVPSKKSNARVQDVRMASSGAYYSGSMRSVDDYNRRWASSYEVLPADTGDVVSFAPVEGVYPDSLGDFALTQRMARFDGYEPSAAYWEGYAQGRRDYMGWHSPWYYSSYYPWYTGWYYDSWYWDPWYWDPWYYGWGWGGYYSYYYPYYGYGWGGGISHVGHRYPGTQNHGHIAGASPRTHTTGRSLGFGGSRRGSFGGTRAGSYGSTGSGSGGFGGSRTTGSFGGSRSGSYGNTGNSGFGGSRTSGSGFGGSRTTRPVSSGSTYSGSTYSGSSSSGSSSSGSSFGGSRSSGSSGGGGSFGGSRSSGGGGGGGGRSGGGGGFGGSRR